MLTYIMLFVSVMLVIIYIFIEIKGRPLFAIFFKGLASFSFILVFVFALFEKIFFENSIFYLGSSFYSYVPVLMIILLGLIAGLIGDLFLALRPLQDLVEDQNIIISGIVCFSVGHLFYFTAFMMMTTFSWLSVIIAVVMTIVIYFMSDKLDYRMGKAKTPTLIYSFLIFLMVGQTLGFAIITGFSTFSMMFLVGALLFSISDLILAPIYYGNGNRPMMVIMNLITYYSAQILIAVSILFLV